MPYFKTSQEWLDQSAALLQARPATTRVVTKYSIKPVKPRKTPPPSSSTNDTTTTTTTPAAAAAAASDPKPPRASLVLKTYDPVGGVTLKYRTTKAAEVSWLVHASLGRLGRAMAGVQDVREETMLDADAAAAAAAGAGATATTTATTTEAGAGAGAGEAQQQQQQQGGGGGKKKKKGKK